MANPSGPVGYRVNVDFIDIPPEYDDKGKLVFGGHKVYRKQILTPDELSVLQKPGNESYLRSCVRISLNQIASKDASGKPMMIDHPHAASLARPKESLQRGTRQGAAPSALAAPVAAIKSALGLAGSSEPEPPSAPNTHAL